MGLFFPALEDRTNLDNLTLQKMRTELVGVISKYVEIDQEAFDVNLEGKVHGANGDTQADDDSDDPTHIRNYAYNIVYNRPNVASRSIQGYKYKPSDNIDIPYFICPFTS